MSNYNEKELIRTETDYEKALAEFTKATGIMLAIKVWDAVNDCIFGVVFDAVKFKSGKKYLPWLRKHHVLQIQN